MADLLLELFSEEIPARMQRDAEAHLVSTLRLKIRDAGYDLEKMEWDYFSTPRRIAVIARGIPDVQPGGTVELKGPKVDSPEQAIQGFLKRTGKKLEELEKRDGVYFAKTEQGGKNTTAILKIIIEAILVSFPWPKSMRWPAPAAPEREKMAGEQAWVRPLHSILCIFDGKVVPVEFAGIKANKVTYGHRFLAPQAITIKSANEYEPALEKTFVIADRAKRRDVILKQAQDAATKAGFILREDEGLLEEVTGLVEWPTVLAGTIDKAYMDLPPEVLVSEMRAHQKYFALQKKDGALADKFLITSNMTAKDGGKAIIAGNERVLRARLADGRFFWDQDRNRKLDDMAKGLTAVTYHAKLGSIADKVGRVRKLAAILADTMKANKKDVERTAALCKADLVSGMVGEFPELQGVMGRYYAMHQKEPQDVADAIRDHYLPLGPSSDIPKKPVSVCVALADKLDTLISMFAIGEKPTGSKDPFALRRAALGVIRIVLENDIRLPLLPLLDEAPLRDIAIHKAHDKLAKQTAARLQETAPGQVGKYLTVNESASEDIPEGAAENIAKSLLAFFHDRLIVQLKDSGIRHDVIKAVIANGDDDLVRIVKRAEAVQAFLDSEDGKNLLAGYKRAVNIVAIEEKKDKIEYADDGIRNSDFKEPEEKTLINAIIPARESMRTSMEKENFVEAMRQLASIRPSVDAFFDKIMVNCEDKALRIKRLKLLSSIRDYMNMVADFSKIEGEAKEQKKAA